MFLTSGSRLGSYEIVVPLGAGGMGEVYRAKDTKLGRDVALKILPASFTNDPERVARFRREAQVLASLNHPHIAQIYGLEEANGTQFLVLELVDGESLDKRIASGPIPVDEALGIAKQIAEALEAAHEKGIIHRDLKPANIALTKDGNAKVLDFGLAKAVEATGSMSDLSMSPTITSPAMMTGVGVILGTAAYMAPEQAKGRAADKRSDVWAYGCVLYEMLVGRRAFEGDDVSDTLAAILRGEPNWSALPRDVSPAIRVLLGATLVKDRAQRIADIAVARFALREMSTLGAIPAGSKHLPWWRRLVIPVAASVGLSFATAGLVWFAVRSTAASPHVSRFVITAPAEAALNLSGVSRDIALTPDGSRVVYIGANGTTLFVRPLDQLEATALVRGAALRDPFVSPDGHWVGFFEGNNALRKVSISGGLPVPIIEIDSPEQGATWTADDTIIFATSATTTGLQRVSANGGVPAVLTRPDRTRGEAGHRRPEMLPGGQAVLYTVMATSGLESASVAILDLRSGKSTILLRGGQQAQYASSGHLVFANGGSLQAVRFDLGRLMVVGTAAAVVPRLITTMTGAVNAALARDGTLVYVAGGDGSFARTLVWVDREGRETPLTAPPRTYFTPRISPDGMRVAVNAVDQTGTIWLWDLGRSTMMRVTFDPAVSSNPVWTPDGHDLVFTSNRAGASNLFRQAADVPGTVERLTESPNLQSLSSLTPDGRWAVFTETSPTTGQDVMALQLDGSHHVLPLVQTAFSERNGIVSPDGRWLAYEANETGTFEVYVRPFPAVNSGHWLVSTNGGTRPLWSRSGQELFYLAADGSLMRVTVSAGAAWTAGAPTRMFTGRYVVSPSGSYGRNYDIAPDGQRFLMIKEGASEAPAAAPQVVVVQHFDEELKRLVPSK
jgi:serine/threonine-protein kinase